MNALQKLALETAVNLLKKNRRYEEAKDLELSFMVEHTYQLETELNAALIEATKWRQQCLEAQQEVADLRKQVQELGLHKETIQLEAFKAGMTEAARIVATTDLSVECDNRWSAIGKAKRNIELTRNYLTQLPQLGKEECEK